jgi:hypothetical protein
VIAGADVRGRPEFAVEARLLVTLAGGSTFTAGGLTNPLPGENADRVLDAFLQDLRSRPAGAYLEIGSRARSGIVRRDAVPAGWSYTGLDVLPGENVDVVGDAHRLSALFPPRTFDAVAAFSVLEHILMPWKLAIELNKVLKVGGVGFFSTHQGWSVHDAPWDFWRFSDTAWAALFNRATGFEIVQAGMGQPASIVANRWSPVVDFRDQPIHLSSLVMFRKVSETTLEWPVELDDVIATHYPPATT